MALNIKHAQADQLARNLAHVTGESITDAVIHALEERLAKVRPARQIDDAFVDELLDIGKRCSALPTLDSRSPEEILGYDQHGLPNHGH